MRLKILADGKHPEKTQFLDSETNRPIEGISYAEIVIEPFSVSAYLIVSDFEFEGKNIKGQFPSKDDKNTGKLY